MFSEYSFRMLFFRVFNFGIFLFLCWYLFKKYFKASLEEKMTQKEALLKGLEEQGCMLEGKELDLEERTHVQELKAQRLKERLQEWATIVAQEQTKRKEEVQQAREVQAARVEQQQMYLEQARLIQALREPVLQQTRVRLQHTFADAKKTKDFTEDLLHKMREKMS